MWAKFLAIDIILLRDGHQFEHVTVRILEVHASTAVPIIEAAIIDAPGRAAEREPGFSNSSEDRVKFSVSHMEGIVVTLDRAFRVEK